MMMERNRRLLFPSFLLLLFAFMVTSLRAQSLPGFLGDPSRFNSKAFKELFFQNMNGAAEEELFLPNCPHYPIPRNVDPQNLPSQIEEAIQQANSSINSFLERKNIAGPIHVSVSINQEVVWEQGYGLTTKKVSQSSTTTPTTPSSTSVFRIGSLTKLFTAMLMLGMRDAGYISSLDDPVQKYEPLFSPKNPFPTSSNITFRQLASHLGGLGREAPCLDLFHSKQDLCFYNSSTIYSRYSSQRLIYPPDTLPSYSNMGFSVIGNALGTILLANQVNLTLDPSCLDVSYEETCMFESAVTKFLFEPLGFECTSFRSPESGVVGGTTGNIVTPQYEAGWTCPAGQIYSCNEDLSKLLSFLMRDDKPVDVNGGQPLDGATIREFLLPRFTNNDGRTGFGTPWENFHMPVNEIAQPLPLEKRASPSAPQGIWVNTKTGMVNGYTANIGLIQEFKLGVSVLCGYGPPNGYCPAIFWRAMYNFAGKVSDYYRSFPQEPYQPVNLDEYTGTYFLKKKLVPLPFELFVSINSENPKELLVYDGSLDGGKLYFGSLIQDPMGDQDGFILLPPRSDPAEFGVNCMTLEDGNYFQPAVFSRDRQGNISSLTMPSLFYGIEFSKSIIV